MCGGCAFGGSHMQQFIGPADKFHQPVIGNAKEGEEHADRQREGEFGHHLGRCAARLEALDQFNRLGRDEGFERRHPLWREQRVEHRAIFAMFGRVEFERDHRPVLADGRGEDAAIGGIACAVLKHIALFLRRGDDPCALPVAGGFGGIEHRWPIEQFGHRGKGVAKGSGAHFGRFVQVEGPHAVCGDVIGHLRLTRHGNPPMFCSLDRL